MEFLSYWGECSWRFAWFVWIDCEWQLCPKLAVLMSVDCGRWGCEPITWCLRLFWDYWNTFEPNEGLWVLFRACSIWRCHDIFLSNLTPRYMTWRYLASYLRDRWLKSYENVFYFFFTAFSFGFPSGGLYSDRPTIKHLEMSDVRRKIRDVIGLPRSLLKVLYILDEHKFNYWTR